MSKNFMGDYDFSSVGELAMVDPADFWISHYTSVSSDGGYPGEGCVVDDLVIATSANTGEKHDSRLHVTRLADVQAWHKVMVDLAEQWLAEGTDWNDVWPDVLHEISWPVEAEAAVA